MHAYRPSHLVIIKYFPILLMRAVLLVSSTNQCILHLQTSSCDKTNVYFKNATYPFSGGPADFSGSEARPHPMAMAVHFDLTGSISSGIVVIRCSARLLSRNSQAVSLSDDTQLKLLCNVFSCIYLLYTARCIWYACMLLHTIHNYAVPSSLCVWCCTCSACA